MTATPLLTAAYLRTLGACAEHVDRFEARWPDGVAVTAAWVRAARADNLDVAWLCARLERPDVWGEHSRALSEWARACADSDDNRLQCACDKLNLAEIECDRAIEMYESDRTTPLACARLIRKHLREGGTR